MAGKNKDFLDIVDQHAPAVPYFPLIHITSISSFYSILTTKSLDVKRCGVFNKNLLYFFYGKPTYEVKASIAGASKKIADAAICLCVTLDAVKPYFEKMHAFDTGAYHGQRYDQYLPSNTDFSDFELPANLHSPAKYANAFFGSNRDYYAGAIRTNLQISPIDVVSEAIINLAGAAVSTEFDERVASVEVQANQPIKLARGTVVAVVAPSRLSTEKRFTDACNDWRIKPLYYRFKRATPESRTEVIYDKLGDYFEKIGTIT